MTKTRSEKTSAAHGGDECEGESSISESCNVQECPGSNYVLFYFNLFISEKCSCQLIFSPSLVDCEWGEWVVGVCSEECGNGVQTMTRTIKIQAQFDGKECVGESSIEESCYVKECPRNQLFLIALLRTIELASIL